MWAKIKVVIRHTVVEQRPFGLPVGCSDIPFRFEQRLCGALWVWSWSLVRVQERLGGGFQLKILLSLFPHVTKDKRWCIKGLKE